MTHPVFSLYNQSLAQSAKLDDADAYHRLANPDVMTTTGLALMLSHHLSPFLRPQTHPLVAADDRAFGVRKGNICMTGGRPDISADRRADAGPAAQIINITTGVRRRILIIAGGIGSSFHVDNMAR